jgi:excisionase family DNA binding protein
MTVRGHVSGGMCPPAVLVFHDPENADAAAQMAWINVRRHCLRCLPPQAQDTSGNGPITHWPDGHRDHGAIMSAIEPFAFGPADAAQFTSLSLTRIKQLLRSKALPFHKDGRRTVILRSDLEAYMTSLGTKVPQRPRGERGRFIPQ